MPRKQPARKAAPKQPPAPERCPSCGYCPVCGQSAQKPISSLVFPEETKSWEVSWTPPESNI